MNRFAIYTAGAALVVGAVNAMQYEGVNLASAEFGESSIPGTYGTDYTYPTSDEVDYYVNKGMNVFRVPFLWERLQTSLQSDLDSTELSRLTTIVDYITSTGTYAILDPHNYARYDDEIIGESGSGVSTDDFADFWARLAREFSDDDQVIFGIMNEPSNLGSSGTELWLEAANAAISSIRDTGATNYLLVPGNYYTGAHSWVSNTVDSGTANANVMGGVVDSLNNFAFELHQYLDSGYSGTSETCIAGSETLESATSWMRTNGYTALLGEIGVDDNTNCLSALAEVMEYMESNSDVWIGYTYWAGGPWWGDYFMTIEPEDSFTSDRPQMDTLESYLPADGASSNSSTTTTTTTTTTTNGNNNGGGNNNNNGGGRGRL